MRLRSMRYQLGSLLRLLAVTTVAVTVAALPVQAQNSEQKPAEKAPPAADSKEAPKKLDEYAEAERLLGGTAANPECLWLGRRVVRLLARDDLDTAFRHLDLYDRFGCPAGHIQAAFRCVIRQGEIDQKATEKIDTRVFACWLNPSPEAQGTAAAPSATTNR
ncbi:MAG: beta-1-3, beta-1-6-glucan biosynthesis protein [Hyphomicrobiales bacterium]|nr:beta-1-3, beta-1-6-glucan biosynthesis protein [Hyphomicrobiales bacterium]